MSETEAFFDTNVLLYLLSGDASKADRAEALVVGGGVISVQVLNEFASVASCKLGMSWAEIREVLQTIRAVCRVDSHATADARSRFCVVRAVWFLNLRFDDSRRRTPRRLRPGIHRGHPGRPMHR